MELPDKKPVTPSKSQVIEWQGLKVPPHSEEVEKAILGALIIDARAIDRVIESIHPEYFYFPYHQTIYQAISSLYTAAKPIDFLSLKTKLQEMGKLKEIGGAAYLVELTENITSAANIEMHALILKEKFIRRELIQVGQNMQNNGYDETVNTFEAVDKAEQEVFQISRHSINQAARPIDEIAHEVMQNLKELSTSDKLPGIPSGYPSLDELTAGWQRGDLIIIAARPSMGKTAFALNLASNMAFANKYPVAYFSLEMTGDQLLKRILARETLIPAEKFRRGGFSEAEEKKLAEKIGYIQNNPYLYINDESMLSIFELRAQARRLKQQYGIEVIIVDYLQLMHASDKMKPGNREQEISTISRNLKSLAKELDIPIIALSQLSRKVEDRASGDKAHKRPMLSDLRESGAIEQDADIVAFIYRPEVYGLEFWDDGQETPAEGEMELFIAKHRNGRTGKLYFRFQKEYGLITERNTMMWDNSVHTFPSKMNEFPSTSEAFGEDNPPTEKPGLDEDDFPF